MNIVPFYDVADWERGTLAGLWFSQSLYADPLTKYPALVPTAYADLVGFPQVAATLIANGIATPNGGHAWTQHNRFLTTDQASDSLTLTIAPDTLYVDIVTTDGIYPGMIDSNGLAWPPLSGGLVGEDGTTGPLQPNMFRHAPIMHVLVDGVLTATVDTANGLASTRMTLSTSATHTVQIVNTGTLGSGSSSDVHRFALVGVVLTAGTSGTARTWTSPVLDAQDWGAQWVGADWETSDISAVSSLTFSYGNTPTPDGTWTTLAIPLVATTIEGVAHGRAGFLMPLGTLIASRFCQLVFTLAANTTVAAPNGSTVPWLRHLDIYTQIPALETMTLLRFPALLRGRIHQGIQAARGAVLCKANADIAELIASYAIPNARGKYLQLYGRDFNIPQAPAESQAAYATRLQAASIGRNTGGTAQYVAEQTGAYMGGTVTVSSYGSAATPWQFTLQMPATWSRPVTQAQIRAFVNQIVPAGHLPNLVF